MALRPPDSLHPCAVRVPCSTSNLGSGFDCIGLAFDTYLDAGYLPGSAPLTIRRDGTLRSLELPLASDLLVLAFTAELRRHGAYDARGDLLVHSNIPVGRGLGSSAAAVVAGIALAHATCAVTLDRDAALAAATRVEGHADNAAPALFGGLVGVAFAEHGGVPRALRLPLAPGIGFVFAAPDATISTERARSALPQHVPHSAATRNLSRLTALLHGLATADGSSIAAGFADELHVPYRLPLIPGGSAAIEAALAAGAWGATISGSGSGLVAACAAGGEARVLDALRAAFANAGHAGPAFVARADMHGVQPRDIGTLREALRV